MEISIGSLPLELKECCRRRGGRIVVARSVDDKRKICLTETIKQDSQWHTNTEVTTNGDAQVCAKSSLYILWMLAWCFC